MTSRFGTKEEVLARLEGFRRYNEWEAANPHELTPEQALAYVDDLYAVLPREAREHEDDPAGKQRMIEILSRLR